MEIQKNEANIDLSTLDLSECTTHIIRMWEFILVYFYGIG